MVLGQPPDFSTTASSPGGVFGFYSSFSGFSDGVFYSGV
jgi:hypothetical protein